MVLFTNCYIDNQQVMDFASAFRILSFAIFESTKFNSKYIENNSKINKKHSTFISTKRFLISVLYGFWYRNRVVCGIHIMAVIYSYCDEILYIFIFFIKATNYTKKSWIYTFFMKPWNYFIFIQFNLLCI